MRRSKASADEIAIGAVLYFYNLHRWQFEDSEILLAKDLSIECSGIDRRGEFYWVKLNGRRLYFRVTFDIKHSTVELEAFRSMMFDVQSEEDILEEI